MRFLIRAALASAFLVLLNAHASAQAADSTSIGCERKCKRCLTFMSAGAGVAAAAAYIGLDQAWYAQYEREPFHTFDDSDEWLLMDKTGHLLSGYMLGAWGHAAMKHCGSSNRSARWIGGSIGLAFMTGIELLDGTSSGWGFSWSDMGANATGAALFIAQDAAWHEQRVVPKISLRLTPYAAQRPDLLGEGIADRLLKDYNGVTLWFSGNIASLSGSVRIPKWLNIAVGYGAEGMISAHRCSRSAAIRCSANSISRPMWTSRASVRGAAWCAPCSSWPTASKCPRQRWSTAAMACGRGTGSTSEARGCHRAAGDPL
ncbi:MAG: DUF2279 domain-containing protein [Flavobacteriales bacterium]|nr:DUF2279 domain-containing protein [Flavobacteriales bacterium]